MWCTSKWKRSSTSTSRLCLISLHDQYVTWCLFVGVVLQFNKFQRSCAQHHSVNQLLFQFLHSATSIVIPNHPYSQYLQQSCTGLFLFHLQHSSLNSSAVYPEKLYLSSFEWWMGCGYVPAHVTTKDTNLCTVGGNYGQVIALLRNL